jgi:antiviral helicase SLH1
MAHSVDVLEAEWLANMAQMRAAIASLKLPLGTKPVYGSDLGVTDSDFTYAPGSDDLWDLISDDSEESEPDLVYEAAPTPPSPPLRRYDRAWLDGQCTAVAARNSGLDSAALFDQIMAVMASDSKG